MFSFRSCSRYIAAFVLLTLLLSCSSDDQSQQQQTAIQSKQAIVDTAMHVQSFMYVYFGCMSANYTTSLYPYTIDEMNQNLDYLEPCMYWMDYELEAIDSGRDDFLQALEDLGVMEQSTTYANQKIFKGFFNLFKSTSSMKSGLSKKFFDTANKLSAQSKTDLYDLCFPLLDTKIKELAYQEGLFYLMVKNGALDHKILNLHNNACNYNLDYAQIAQNEKNLPGRVITRDVSKIVAAGGEIVVGTGKSALSGLSVVTEAIDVIKVTKDLISTTESTSGEAIANGKTIDQDIHDRLKRIGLEDSADLSVVQMAEKLSQVLTDHYIDAVVREDPVNNVPALLNLGYSQITIQPDNAHSSSVQGNLDDSLMVISTGTDLFSGTRIVIASADTVNNPIIVSPATYDLTVVSGSEVQLIESVTTSTGQNTTVTLDPNAWEDRSQSSSSTGGCSGTCDIMTDYQYCTDGDLCLCGTSGWYIKDCQDYCQQSGLGDSVSCQKDSSDIANCVCDSGADGDVIVDGDTSPAGTCSVPYDVICHSSFIGADDLITTPGTMNQGSVCTESFYGESSTLDCESDGTIRESIDIDLCDDGDPTTFDTCDLHCDENYKCLNVKVGEVGSTIPGLSCSTTGISCAGYHNSNAIGTFDFPSALVECVDGWLVIIEICKCNWHSAVQETPHCYH